jgi:hypothetical protein
MAGAGTSNAVFPMLMNFTPEIVNKLFPLIDRVEDATFYDYLFLRRINSALLNCGMSGTM